ncbi:MAG: hypothetical protein JRJ14_05680 [Deltaproteobacteria bacterium]|nr:hypothetical protein [Deltaproteobacteria bacterium]
MSVIRLFKSVFFHCPVLHLADISTTSAAFGVLGGAQAVSILFLSHDRLHNQ